MKGNGRIMKMTDHPTAVCGNISIGLPTCNKGRRGKCYWLGTCASQMRLDNPNERTPNAERLYRQEKEKVLSEARSKVIEDPDISEGDLNKIIKMLL